MEAKLLIALLMAINCYTSCGAALRRTPKVYNALITTDENLASSRAYPVIQPTIHETGIAQYPFGPYNPYGGFYGHPLVRFGQPIAPGLVPREQQIPYPLPQHQFPPQVLSQHQHPQPQAFPGYPLPQQHPPTAPGTALPTAEATAPAPSDQKQQPVKPPTATPDENAPAFIMPPEAQRPQQVPSEKLPIPLNEFGLPPALIPLQQYPDRHGNPVHLPPFGYNQYPLLYDPVTGYREQFLPPYEYYPSHGYVVGPTPHRTPGSPQTAAPYSPNAPATPATPTAASATEETTSGDESTPPATELNFDSIKNVSESKNHAVPDVPPPPIPSGAKAKQS